MGTKVEQVRGKEEENERKAQQNVFSYYRMCSLAIEQVRGIEYTIVLKRGAWGAEHAVVSPEDRDMLDKQRCRMCLAYMCAYMCAFMCAYLFALYDLLICVRGP